MVRLTGKLSEQLNRVAGQLRGPLNKAPIFP